MRLAQMGSLTFFEPDLVKFVNLRLAFDALRADATGGSAAIILNASNEVAVDAFLNQRIRFLDIARVNEQALNTLVLGTPNSLDDICAVDAQTRAWATEHIQKVSF